MLALHSAFRALRSALLLSLLATAYCLLPTGAAAQDDPFASGVRTTPWLSPADEQKAFQLPPGFEINLVAAEPDIQKPLNMAFDERGRIWLTNTIEYPYAAPPDHPAQDTIKILEDTDGDGRFEKVTTFADGLNIPMGIYPWKGGCVAFSIPNIWHFEDTDGDGVCDKRTVLYGPFDTTRDTHGMINALRRGWDGWVYACHGFNNDSRVKGTDGHEIHMQSGNVFRFKLDGSRIEHFTHGQVNPFGMCFDEYFNIFTADCHSKPVYQLLRGGYYPSFGKPHDGLGFVPPMMDHLHGSTAICGLVKYSGENFPEEFRGDFYSGNVMTSRINRNKPEYHGSTIKAIEQPDFLSTTDPWFRPVDLQIGPDGAMYILDFYNRIIGHYEVPLPHPGRDRTSGRIWRVSYKSESAVGNALRGVSSATNPRDLTKLTTSELISQLDSPQLEHRLRALNYLVDKQGKTAIPELSAALQSNNSPHARIDARWALERLAALSEPLRVAAVVSNNREEQVHALKLAAERLAFQPVDRDAALAILKSSDGFVSRAAAESLSLHDTDLPPLLDAWTAASSDDNHLNYMIRLAIRRNFRSSLDQAIVTLSQLPDARWRELAPIAAVVNEKMAAEWLFAYLQKFDESDDVVAQYLGQISRHTLSPTHRPGIVEWAKKRAGTDLDRQLQFVNAIASGATRDIRAEVRPWAIEVCEALLTSNNANRIPWTAVPIDNLPPSESPWVVTPRASRDGDKDSLFFSSLPRGEQRTGIYRSAAFDLPAELSFWCSGHSGRPPAPLNDANYIRLRDAQTHEILAESRPPRNDTARLITWKRGAGLWPAMSPRRGYIELIDADTANAYAWFAVGRFSLPALNPSDAPQKQQLAAEIIGKLKLDSLKPQLVSLVAAPNTDSTARTAIAQALLAFAPDARASTLTAALSDAQLPDDLRPKIGAAVATRDSATLLDCLRDVLKRSPLRLQTTLAQTLAGDVPGADALLTLIEAGQAAPRLLLLPAVNNKLTALKNADLDARSTAITSKLPPADAVLDALITDRRRAFAQAKTNIERGQTVFTKHCASCHKIADKGNLIGPQLDGIGSRGLDRLLEDILDPNRNVDIAFRTTTLRLSDGRVLSGLHRREEGTQLILADNQGKEFSIAKSEIDEQKKTPLSLMPANVLEIVPPDEFADLIAYLLNQRAPTNK